MELKKIIINKYYAVYIFQSNMKQIYFLIQLDRKYISVKHKSLQILKTHVHA